METWQEILRRSVDTPAALLKHLDCDSTALGEVIANFPMRINPYFLQLIRYPGDPVWLQAVPDIRELHDEVCQSDPLGEEAFSRTPHLVHKYADRALFLVSGTCAMYCRFCTRKRTVGSEQMCIRAKDLEEGFRYIEEHPEIKDVLLSGGDPLLLSDDRIEMILTRLRAIPSVEIIRIGSRIPSVLPMRITPELVAVLKRFHPLYINTHFNHPWELTAEAHRACAMLADAGVPMGCQTVLLRGVNDNAATLETLFRGLLRMRVKPYYLFQTDLTRGTDHFRTPISCGINIMRSLYGRVSGMAVPTFALDAPDGKGKIPLTPQYIHSLDDKMLRFENYRGEKCSYPEAQQILP